MSDENASPSSEPSTPDLPSGATTVVGYPAVAPSAAVSGQVTPGMASLRSSVNTVRALAIASLALLLVLAVGFVVGLASMRAQVSDLSAQVAALGAQPAAAAPESAPAPAAAAPQEAAAPEPEIMSQAPTLPEGTVIPAGADTAGAILVGDPNASTVVEVYVDYQCPYCQRWETEVGTALVERALAPGSDLLIKQYNLAFLGETSPTLEPAGASARAANAAACVLEGEGAEAFVAYNTGVFGSADPNEPAGQFTTEVLTSLAQELGASPETITCISDERHVPFVATSTQAGFGRGVGGTPTVLVNGQAVENPFSDPALAEIILG